MDEYIEREAVYEDFKKCNSVDPKWTPVRVMALIARQKPPMLPRCGMDGGFYKQTMRERTIDGM